MTEEPRAPLRCADDVYQRLTSLEVRDAEIAGDVKAMRKTLERLESHMPSGIQLIGLGFTIAGMLVAVTVWVTYRVAQLESTVQHLLK